MWLRIVGTVETECDDWSEFCLGSYKGTKLQVRWFAKSLSPRVNSSFAVYFGGSMCMRNPTRGEVRQLCKLLEIELRVV